MTAIAVRARQRLDGNTLVRACTRSSTASRSAWSGRDALLVRFADELQDTCGVSDGVWSALAARDQRRLGPARVLCDQRRAHRSEFVVPSIVAGVGVSMAIPSAQNSVIGSFSVEEVGKAAGANSMMRELGGVFGVAVAAAVFAGAGGFASPDAFLDGFAPAVAVLAGFSLVGAIVALALPGRRRTAESVTFGAVPALEGAGGS
jgi:hypothetical protein